MLTKDCYSIKKLKTILKTGFFPIKALQCTPDPPVNKVFQRSMIFLLFQTDHDFFLLPPWPIISKYEFAVI